MEMYSWILRKFQSRLLLLAVLSFGLFSVKAEVAPSEDEDVVSSFQPSLAVVIGVLSIMFSLTFLLLLYAKFCHRASSSVRNNTNIMHIQDGLVRSVLSCSSGIDKTVVESLPFFRFSYIRGSKQGLECVVCLSKFEDIEILRLLPKCKHAFHIDCIDKWLEKHSTCPLCRHKVSAEDLSLLTYSDSLRFLWNQPELRDESNLELYIQREENGSSRFSIGSSFKKEEESPIQENNIDNQNQKALHRFNHRIIVSDVVFKNRWSNVSFSDLMFLNSEMLNGMASNRFSSMDRITEQSTAKRVIEEEGQRMNIKDEMERKRLFESKIQQNDLSQFPEASESRTNSSKSLSQNEKRCMSEIIVHPRFIDFNNKNIGNRKLSERRRKLWLPIARRTVKWFANRERRSSHTENRRQTLNV
ncbi:PREDICTED: E3 ubiquitin-protein ligase ATL42-like [Nicotiana attenuata]|uniref:RING-type E3 ubiquitin transferase n=1 Tax=Nicotiana attenuata TaxID=49451 RepID=A0A1J6KK09_NICAT|nr:PREDICTED: E3 ubiquitin-protein ligase ATL42-like [Nicotiana attenuata]OIT23131.1 e3 ubiquitin-protein ligase atl42 [Nicotiana attenuata]